MKKALSVLDLYGKRASGGNFQEIAGRFVFQKRAEQYLLHDVLHKLSLSPEDDLLEIGCGAGNLLAPLSFFVKSATGIDHPKLLKKLRSRIPNDNETITLLSGDFLDAKFSKNFSKILICGVVHYLRDEKQLCTFISKAAKLLKPGGKMLIAEIPNLDKKARFLSTDKGKKFSAQWRKETRAMGTKNSPMSSVIPMITIDDRVIHNVLNLLHGLKLHAYVVPQPESLPFSFTREDILAERK